MLVNTSAEGNFLAQLSAHRKLQPHHSYVRLGLHDNTTSGHGANVEKQGLFLFQPLHLKKFTNDIMCKNEYLNVGFCQLTSDPFLSASAQRKISATRPALTLRLFFIF